MSSSPSLYSYLGLPRPKHNTFHLAFLNLIRRLHAHFLSLSSIPPFYCVNCTTHHHQQTCLGYTWSHYLCHWQRCWKTVVPRWTPGGTSLRNGLQWDIELLTTTPWLQPSNQFFIHLVVQSSNPYLWIPELIPIQNSHNPPSESIC